MDSDADHPGIEAARRVASRRALLREARGALGAGRSRAEVDSLVTAARQLVAAAGGAAERADGAHGLASFFVAVGDDAAAEPWAREAISAEREAGRGARRDAVHARAWSRPCGDAERGPVAPRAHRCVARGGG